jgi:hypothetical protein
MQYVRQNALPKMRNVKTSPGSLSNHYEDLDLRKQIRNIYVRRKELVNRKDKGLRVFQHPRRYYMP